MPSFSQVPTMQAVTATAEDVCAVIVTYKPDVTLLGEVMEALSGQVGGGLLYDNATCDERLDQYISGLADAKWAVFRSPANVGLGAAINDAVDFARKSGFKYLLLLDQDSRMDNGAVTTLKEKLLVLQAGAKVAAVGAQFRDSRTGVVAPFVRIGFPFNRKLLGGPGQVVGCDFLISSGSLLPLDALDAVGGMKAELFIDNIDLEWSFRARHLGYSLYGICDAGMLHSIGDSIKATRWSKSGTFIHSPLRLYYMMRNRVLLYGYAETPWLWIFQDVPRLCAKFLRMSLFVPPRASYLFHMLRGLRDGILRRGGPLSKFN
jgi:rhamnosyltransferase